MCEEPLVWQAMRVTEGINAFVVVVVVTERLVEPITLLVFSFP